MKAKNSEKIIRGYLEFAGGLLISTALSMAHRLYPYEWKRI